MTTEFDLRIALVLAGLISAEETPSSGMKALASAALAANTSPLGISQRIREIVSMQTPPLMVMDLETGEVREAAAK